MKHVNNTGIFRAWLYVFLALFLNGCSHGVGSSADAPTSTKAVVPTVTVATAQRGILESVIQATGMLSPVPGHEAILVPQVSGTLIAVQAQLGKPVAAGQIVARISPVLIQGQIQQARATLSQNVVQVQQAKANYVQQKAQTKTSILQAQANERSAEATLASDEATLTGDQAALTNAQSTYTREQNLFTAGLAPGKDVDAAQLAVQTAKAQVDAQVQTVNAQKQIVAGQKQAVEAAKSSALTDDVKRSDISVANAQVSNASGALQALSSQEALYTLRAPISGYITQIAESVGSSVDTSTKLITITDTRVLQVSLAIPTASASNVHVGQRVAFTAEALPGKTYYCAIESISTQVDPITGTVQALGAVSNLKSSLKDDMAISAQIMVQKRVNVVEVPEAAVLVDSATGDSSVATIDTSSILHIVPVTTGLRADGKVEIIKGLIGGEKIATSGGFGLTDGTQVNSASPGSAN